MGDIDYVLVNCRKAQQAMGEYVKKAGFKKQEEKEGEKHTYVLTPMAMIQEIQSLSVVIKALANSSSQWDK